MHQELKSIRLDMGFSIRDMASELGLSAPTYQGYEQGTRKVPQHVVEQAIHSSQKVREFMASAPARIEARIEAWHPFGFMGEASDD